MKKKKGSLERKIESLAENMILHWLPPSVNDQMSEIIANPELAAVKKINWDGRLYTADEIVALAASLKLMLMNFLSEAQPLLKQQPPQHPLEALFAAMMGGGPVPSPLGMMGGGMVVVSNESRQQSFDIDLLFDQERNPSLKN